VFNNKPFLFLVIDLYWNVLIIVTMVYILGIRGVSVLCVFVLRSGVSILT